MEKYHSFKRIRKSDIERFSGLDRELIFAPIPTTKRMPLEVNCFGITNPDSEYYIKRNPSPCFIIEYIVSGKGYLKIGGVTHQLSANDAYIIHPGDRVEYGADKNDPYKKFWINFRSPVFFELFSAYGVTERVFKNLDLSEYFTKIFATESISQFNDELCFPISVILFDLIVSIAKRKSSSENEHKLGLAAEIKHILNHSPHVDINLDDVAKKHYCSKSEIIRVFKKAYGITPYAYLISLRIDLAKNLLADSNKTVKEIADYLRFSSEYYFSNFFREKVGVSPREYRKRAKEDKT